MYLTIDIIFNFLEVSFSLFLPCLQSKSAKYFERDLFPEKEMQEIVLQLHYVTRFRSTLALVLATEGIVSMLKRWWSRTLEIFCDFQRFRKLL